MSVVTHQIGENVRVAFTREARFLGELEPENLSNLGLVSTLPASLGFIAPVTKNDLNSTLIIRNLCRWRNGNLHAFESKTAVTEESTKLWLEEGLASGLKILFKILSPSQEMVGHIGLAWNLHANRLEIDNVIRGEPESPGIMGAALKFVERYAHIEFNALSLFLRVVETNDHAISFYRNQGYLPTDELPLDEIPGKSEDSQGVGAYRVMAKSLTRQSGNEGQLLTAGPSIGFRERAYSAESVSFGWNARSSSFLDRLEESFSQFIGVSHALATSSCTGALHLALAALGVGPGDEVIVPAITWVATASAVRYVGAQPIFVDVDADSWTLDHAKIEEKISARTKAIIAVHLYGFVAHIREIKEFCDARGLYLVEDAAPAIGATSEGKNVGSFGHFGCFSFQGAKLLVSGEGGMLVSNSPDLMARARKLQEHGRRPGTFIIDELGYKYKMSNQTAALALGQLERAQPQIDRKRMIAGWYRELLADCPGIRFQTELEGTKSIHWMTSVAVTWEEQGQHAVALRGLLAEKAIDSRPVFPNLAGFEFWRQQPEELLVAEQLANNAINLPSGVNLVWRDVERVAHAIQESIKRPRSS